MAQVLVEEALCGVEHLERRLGRLAGLVGVEPLCEPLPQRLDSAHCEFRPRLDAEDVGARRQPLLVSCAFVLHSGALRLADSRQPHRRPVHWCRGERRFLRRLGLSCRLRRFLLGGAHVVFLRRAWLPRVLAPRALRPPLARHRREARSQHLANLPPQRRCVSLAPSRREARQPLPREHRRRRALCRRARPQPHAVRLALVAERCEPLAGAPGSSDLLVRVAARPVAMAALDVKPERARLRRRRLARRTADGPHRFP